MSGILRKSLSISCFILSLLFCSSSWAYNELKNISLTVGVYPSGAPFAYLDKNITTPKGIDIDIINELRRRLGFFLTENRMYPVDFLAGLDRVKEGRLDIFAGGISYSEERAQLYDYSPIYYFASLGVVYSKKNFPVTPHPKDFKGKRVGYMQKTTADAYIEHYEMEGVPINNLTLAFFQVQSGELDGVLFDRPALANFVQTMKGTDLAVTEERFGEESCQFALLLAKDSPFRPYIEMAMEDMMMDGTLQAILDKWNAE